jgi:tetratricopeptide (TPR) repeat protein
MASWTRKILLAAAAILVAEGEASAASRELAPVQDETTGEDFVEIPGVGRIQLPPGVRGYQPHGAQRRKEEAETLAPPPKSSGAFQARQNPSAARANMLDALFRRLRDTEDAPEAEAIAARIRALFALSSSDTITLLAARAAAAELGGATGVASTLLDRVIALDAGWSEGFMRRARLRAGQGDPSGARADLETALRLEPRRFDALATLGALKEEAGDKKGALEAYRRALALDPKQEVLKKAEERLRLDVEGRDI